MCGLYHVPRGGEGGVRDHLFEAVYGAFHLRPVRHIVFHAIHELDAVRDVERGEDGGRTGACGIPLGLVGASLLLQNVSLGLYDIMGYSLSSFRYASHIVASSRRAKLLLSSNCLDIRV